MRNVNENWLRVLSLSSVFFSTIGQRWMNLLLFDLCFEDKDLLYYNAMLLKNHFLAFSLCRGIIRIKGRDRHEWHLVWSVFLRSKFWACMFISSITVWWNMVRNMGSIDENGSSMLSLSSVFSSAIGQNCLNWVTFNLSFKGKDFDVS